MALIHWEDVIQASIYSSAEADGRVIFFSLLFFLLRAPQFQHIEYEWGVPLPLLLEKQFTSQYTK